MFRIPLCVLLLCLFACNASCPPNLKLRASELKSIQKYQGCEATITGKVFNTYNSGKIVFLNLDNSDHKKAFPLVIFTNRLPRFKRQGIKNVENFYKGKEIAVTGTISEYKGREQMVISSPQQIQEHP